MVSEIFTFLALLGAEKKPVVRSSAEGRGQSLLAVNVSIWVNNIFFKVS